MSLDRLIHDTTADPAADLPPHEVADRLLNRVLDRALAEITAANDPTVIAALESVCKECVAVRSDLRQAVAVLHLNDGRR